MQYGESNQQDYFDKGKYIVCDENLIKKASIEEMYILRVEDFWRNKIKSAQRLWKNLVAAESLCEAPLRRKTV